MSILSIVTPAGSCKWQSPETVDAIELYCCHKGCPLHSFFLSSTPHLRMSWILCRYYQSHNLEEGSWRFGRLESFIDLDTYRTMIIPAMMGGRRRGPPSMWMFALMGATAMIQSSGRVACILASMMMMYDDVMHAYNEIPTHTTPTPLCGYSFFSSSFSSSSSNDVDGYRAS